MGDRKAALQGASTTSVPLARTPSRPDSVSLARTRSFAFPSNPNLHLPLGMCGMRIAAHPHEAPVGGGSRQLIEEVA